VHFFLSLCENAIVRYIVLLFERFFWAAGRLWSHLRFRALVRDAGQQCTIHWTTNLKHPGNLHLGSRVRISRACSIGSMGGVFMGNNITVSHGVIIESDSYDIYGQDKRSYYAKPINISDDVWIAAGAIILQGVNIGKGAVIGAGAVITKDVAEGSVIVGFNRNLHLKEIR